RRSGEEGRGRGTGRQHLRDQIRPPHVLLRLDALLSDGEAKYDYEVVSIEHVLLQNPDPNGEWVQRFPDPADREEVVQRLGNLLLLSHRKNSSASNYDFDTKKKKYFKSQNKVSPFALTTQVLNGKAWNADVIRRRQGDLLGRLKTLRRL